MVTFEHDVVVDAPRLSPRTRFQVIDKVSHHEHAHVHRRSLPFAESVVAVGIDHVVESLCEFDESIHQSFDNLKVCVGLA